jgi:hypothetical protein
MPEEILVVEGQAAARGDVARDARPLEHRFVQRGEPRAFAQRPCGRLREGIAEAGDRSRTRRKYRVRRSAGPFCSS